MNYVSQESMLAEEYNTVIHYCISIMITAPKTAELKHHIKYNKTVCYDSWILLYGTMVCTAVPADTLLYNYSLLYCIYTVYKYV